MWESVIREASAAMPRTPAVLRASLIPHSVSSWTIVRLMHPAAIRPPEGDV